jgi:Rha family phage regulatory protein|nr:MAG TPA: regulatory protein [Caudoviricetes sp.]DAU31387.1 MAG TPA: regulatory protein [Caudoviricetes sp.]
MPVNIEQKTLTSVEVAEMVGKPHNDLMKDIRRYTSQFNEGNISHVEFFTENTYLDKKGQERPCYLVTKKGCEFIAHKLTGVKGTEFTAKYINRFHELEEHVQKPRTALEQIALLAQGALELEEKVDSVEQEVYSIKNDMPLFGAESDELSAHVKRKGVEMLGGKKSEAYKDNKVRQTVYRDIYSQLKREFGIYDDEGKTKSYKALKRKDLADAHEFIDCYTLPSYLQDVITNCNAQIRMDGDLCGV